MTEEIIITSRTDTSVSFKVLNEVEGALRDRAVAQAKKTIENRIDELGLREAAVSTRDEDIIIEVPGEDESTFNDIKDTIARTARLEFKMCDDEANFFEKLDPKSLPQGIAIVHEHAPIGPGASEEDTHYTDSRYLIAQVPEKELPQQTLAHLKEYVKTLGVPDDRQVGYEECFTTTCESASRGPNQDPNAKPKVVAFRTYYLQRRADVTGEYITEAVAMPSDRSGPQTGWEVELFFTATGADKFQAVTRANIKKRFAIILDEKVNSAPVIQGEIGGGRAQITMGGSRNPNQQRDEAKKLEMILRSGALPAPIVMSNDQRIGASLGADSIRLGLRGSMVGSILVLIFMVIYYHWGGLVADIAVLFNLLLQMTALAIFGASMTLPGIAGLALTIGMAVDANVLINERIREEMRDGKSPRAAVEAGYHKAFAAIFDGHVTTALGGLLLYQFGSGPIKGFAVTLIIGIVASLFTAVFCTRIVFDWWVLGRRTKKLDIG
jgi:preprotein translocase subunit SecD